MPASAPMIHHSRPTTGPEEAAAVAEVLASGHHARGPVTRRFEGKLAALVSLAHAHATASGTAALELTLRALGAAPGRSVVIPSLTCAAVWNAVRLTGAEAVFHDGDYGAPNAADLGAWVRDDTCAVVMVAPMDRAVDLDAAGCTADGHGFATVAAVPVVLDRCQQLHIGPSSGLRARAEVFSFFATKCISTGMGGAIATNDPELHGRVLDLNTHDGRDDYPGLRLNHQFDDIRAAVGEVQLGRLAVFIHRRQQLAASYHEALRASSLRVAAPENSGMVYRMLADCGGLAACDALIRALAGAHIEAKRPVFRPLHRYAGMPDSQFPRASDAWERTISMPVYPSLTDGELGRVLEAMAGL